MAWRARGHARRRATSLILVGLAAAVVAGCNSSKRPTPHLHALPPTSLERQWLARWSLKPRSPTAGTPQSLRHALIQETDRPGVQLVSLVSYRAPGLATAVTIAVSQPASFLRHQLTGILTTLTATHPYLRVVDSHGAPVLEFYNTDIGGAQYLARRDLLGCSPIVERGLRVHLPPCPAR